MNERNESQGDHQKVDLLKVEEELVAEYNPAFALECILYQ